MTEFNNDERAVMEALERGFRRGTRSLSVGFIAAYCEMTRTDVDKAIEHLVELGQVRRLPTGYDSVALKEKTDA